MDNYDSYIAETIVLSKGSIALCYSPVNRIILTMVMIMKQHFDCGLRLRQLRQAKGLSQEELALEAEVTTAYVGQIERGIRNPTVLVVDKLCRAMRLSLSEFFQDFVPIEREEDYYLNQISQMLSGKSVEEKKAYLQLLQQVEEIQKLSNS